jgi:succinoglycan biosynthesis protein ExoV
MTKIYYYRAKGGNFGDDLNLWLWPHLIPDLEVEPCGHGTEFLPRTEGEPSLLVGIGTLLDNRLPRQPLKIICGTGAGYFSRPNVDASWRIMWLRGPRTAALLGEPPVRAITDGATLLARMSLPALRPPTAPFGFMPHHTTAGFPWRTICERLNIHYIDPTAGVEETLVLLRSTRCLITEAMHGAIVADTLRIPWIPVATHLEINAFKWQDWCEAMELSYRPHRLPALWPIQSEHLAKRLKFWVKEEVAIARLRRIMRHAEPVLSRDKVFDRALDRLEGALIQARAEVRRLSGAA